MTTALVLGVVLAVAVPWQVNGETSSGNSSLVPAGANSNETDTAVDSNDVDVPMKPGAHNWNATEAPGGASPNNDTEDSDSERRTTPINGTLIKPENGTSSLPPNNIDEESTDIVNETHKTKERTDPKQNGTEDKLESIAKSEHLLRAIKIKLGSKPTSNKNFWRKVTGGVTAKKNAESSERPPPPRKRRYGGRTTIRLG